MYEHKASYERKGTINYTKSALSFYPLSSFPVHAIEYNKLEREMVKLEKEIKKLDDDINDPNNAGEGYRCILCHHYAMTHIIPPKTMQKVEYSDLRCVCLCIANYLTFCIDFGANSTSFASRFSYLLPLVLLP